MTMVVKPGLRDSVWLFGWMDWNGSLGPEGDGFAMSRNPSRVEARPEYEETVEYFLDGSVQIDRELKWSDEDAGIAAPDVTRRWSFAFDWESISGKDFIDLESLKATPYIGNFDTAPANIQLCLWRPIVETFTCDGVKKVFLLTHEAAVYPDGSYLYGIGHAYATVIYKDGVVDTTVTFNASSVNIGAKITTATAYAKGTIIECYYVPIFIVRPSGNECSFPAYVLEGLRLQYESVR